MIHPPVQIIIPSLTACGLHIVTIRILRLGQLLQLLLSSLRTGTMTPNDTLHNMCNTRGAEKAVLIFLTTTPYTPTPLLSFAHIAVPFAVHGRLPKKPLHVIHGTQPQSTVRGADAELVPVAKRVGFSVNYCEREIDGQSKWGGARHVFPTRDSSSGGGVQGVRPLMSMACRVPDSSLQA